MTNLTPGSVVRVPNRGLGYVLADHGDIVVYEDREQVKYRARRSKVEVVAEREAEARENRTAILMRYEEAR